MGSLLRCFGVSASGSCLRWVLEGLWCRELGAAAARREENPLRGVFGVGLGRFWDVVLLGFAEPEPFTSAGISAAASGDEGGAAAGLLGGGGHLLLPWLKLWWDLKAKTSDNFHCYCTFHLL